MATPPHRRNTHPTRKRLRSAISEPERSEQDGKRRCTKEVTRVEDLIPSLKKVIGDLQERVSALEKGNSSEGTTSEPKEPEPSNNIQCPLCVQSFTRSQNLTRHLKHAHGVISNKFCEKCDRWFERLSDYSRHMNLHYRRSGGQTFWENIVATSSSGSQAGPPEQLSSQPRRDLVDATPLHLQSAGDMLDAARSNPPAEQTQQLFSQETWDIFSAVPSDPLAPAQQLHAQETWDIFSAAPDPSVEPIQQLLAQETWDIFSAAPDPSVEPIQQLHAQETWDIFSAAPDPSVEPIQQPFSQEDRGMVNAIPSNLALGVDDVETFIKDITRGLLRNAASDPSVIPRLLTLSGGVKAGG